MQHELFSFGCRLKEQKIQEEITVETIDLETVNSHFAAPTSDSGSNPDHFIIVESCREASNSDNTEIVDDNRYISISSYCKTIGYVVVAACVMRFNRVRVHLQLDESSA